MKNSLSLLFTLLIIVLTVTNCNKSDNIDPEDVIEYGYISLQLNLEIEQFPAGRVAGVNTDDFIVTIHKGEDGSEVMRFDPFSSVPAEIQLPTGEYFVRATNLEPPENAAFEQPWYFGESDVFNIDKEELKAIDVYCSLANFKVSFVYSQNVLDDFSDWNATATLINEGDFLDWPKGDDREGYFITSPLDIDVYLEYTKVFSGELITRNFTATIDDPQPATLYRINIDAALEDGKIVININVDEGFEVIDIDLGDNQPPADPPNPDGTVSFDGYAYQTVQIGNQTWMAENIRATNYADGTPVPADQIWDGDPVYGKYYSFSAASWGGSTSTLNPSGIQGVCPNGWHLPSLSEYQELANFLGGENTGGGPMKSNSALWNTANVTVPDLSGFGGEPSGWHLGSSPWQDGDAGIWWTTTEYELSSDFSYGFLIYYNNLRAVPSQSNKTVGKCVRCLQN